MMLRQLPLDQDYSRILHRKVCDTNMQMTSKPQYKHRKMRYHLFRTLNMNKSSFPEIVHEQSESESFVTLVEIHNVDVPVFIAHHWHYAVAKHNRGKLRN